MEYVIDPKHPHLGGNIQGGDYRTYYPLLWKWLVDRYSVRTVLDVGCGEGHASHCFAAFGCDVVALDGLSSNLAGLPKHIKPVVCDLTQTSCPIPHTDLVWCCEVVEHIHERSIDHLLDTICCGRVLAMTHAVPGQGGHHHVNCQPAEYWIERVFSRGFTLDREATDASRGLAKHYWQATGLIFTRTH